MQAAAEIDKHAGDPTVSARQDGLLLFTPVALYNFQGVVDPSLHTANHGAPQPDRQALVLFTRHRRKTSRYAETEVCNGLCWRISIPLMNEQCGSASDIHLT